MSQVAVNGVRVDPAGYPSPEAATARELLRQHALQIGLIAEDADSAAVDAALECLLEREASAAAPSEEECRRYYAAHPEEFTSGELAFARHILFQVTSGVSVPALRANAELMLTGLLRDASKFEAVARDYSNCPSAQAGGHLGPLARGETVPELDQPLFNGTYLGIYPQLVKSRFGFHILAVDRRERGLLEPFERVHERIAGALTERRQRAALVRYIGRIAADAEITGVDLGSVEAKWA